MKETKNRILSGGLDLLSQGGFEKITLGVLAQHTKISKSGLFAHFGSKEAIQLCLLDEMLRVIANSFVNSALHQPKGLKRLRSMVTGWIGWSQKAGLPGGCPAAAGMFELDDIPKSNPVRRRLAAIEEQWRGTLAMLVTQAVQTGELRSDLDVDQFVWELNGIYLSHHVSHRFVRNPLATEHAIKAFDAMVERSSRVTRLKTKGRLPQKRN